MLYKSDYGNFFNLSTLIFLIIAIMLTLFSVIYGDWYNSNFTGWATGDEGDEKSEGGWNGEEALPVTPYEEKFTINKVVPQVVISQVYNNYLVVSRSVDYSNSVIDIVDSDSKLSEDELIRLRDRIKFVGSDSVEKYDDSFAVSKGYRSKVIDQYLGDIVEDISIIEKNLNKINSRLSKNVYERQKKQREFALWDLERENNIKRSKFLVDSYLDNIISYDEDITIGDDCFDDEKCKASKKCLPLTYLISIDESVVDFGPLGYDLDKKSECNMDTEVRLRPPSLNPKNPKSPIVGLDKTPSDKDSDSKNKISTFYVSRRNSEGENYEAVVIKGGDMVTFNFFSSPNFADLEREIYEFIYGIFYGEGGVGSNFLSGLSVKQVNEIIDESHSVPWVLWAILSVMIFLYLFFGKMFYSHHERLIYFGKKSLNKKDFYSAIKNYNELSINYSNDFRVRQDILNYLKLLKDKIGNDNIHLDFMGKGTLPTIKYKNLTNTIRGLERVEKMINHALIDIKKNPKLVKARMNLIAEEYSKLENKEKELLAFNYESLVYKLKTIK